MGQKDEARTRLTVLAPVVVTAQGNNAFTALLQFASQYRKPKKIALAGPRPVRAPRARPGVGLQRGTAKKIEDFQYTPSPLTQSQLDARREYPLRRGEAKPFDFALPAELLTSTTLQFPRVSTQSRATFEPVTVTAKRPSSFQTIANPLIYTPVRPTTDKPRSIPSNTAPKRGTLTPVKQPSVRSKTKSMMSSLADLSPSFSRPSDTKTKTDECKQERKRDRNKCPSRGYRLRATAWRKEPCL